MQLVGFLPDPPEKEGLEAVEPLTYTIIQYRKAIHSPVFVKYLPADFNTKTAFYMLRLTPKLSGIGHQPISVITDIQITCPAL